jgi:hypothetical protein
VKTNRRVLLAITTGLLAFAIVQPARLSAESRSQWTVKVSKVDAGRVGLSPSFQIAIYENLLTELDKTQRFKQVLRHGEHRADDVNEVLVLKTTVQKYTPGSETRRAVTTVTGSTKLSVNTQLSTLDGKVILERTVNGNVRFFGSNLRATHNLAHNIAKTIKKSSLPEPPLSAAAKAINPTSSDDIVVVEFP